MPTASAKWARRVAKQIFRLTAEEIDEEELFEYVAMTDKEIDERVRMAKIQIGDIEFRKKFRRNARESGDLRVYETEDAGKLKTSNMEKVVLDRVPPKVRRDIIARG